MKSIPLESKNSHFLLFLISTLNSHGINTKTNDFRQLTVDLRKKMTPKLVQDIYIGVNRYASIDSDIIKDIESLQTGNNILYGGYYHWYLIAKSLSRHLLYCDKFIVINPFYHFKRHPQISPLKQPAAHIVYVYYGILLWLILSEAITKELVVIIDDPELVHSKLSRDSSNYTEKLHGKSELIRQYTKDFRNGQLEDLYVTIMCNNHHNRLELLENSGLAQKNKYLLQDIDATTSFFKNGQLIYKTPPGHNLDRFKSDLTVLL